MTLGELQKEIVHKWPISESKYPEIKHLSHAQRELFMCKHIFLHQMKALGKVAEVLEKADHGAKFEKEAVDAALTKLLFSALRMFHVIGTSGEKLGERVHRI